MLHISEPLTLITFLDKFNCVFLHSLPKVTCSNRLSHQGTRSWMVSTYAFMDFSQHIYCFLRSQAFQVWQWKSSFVKFTIHDSESGYPDFNLLCFWLVRWELVVFDIRKDRVNPSARLLDWEGLQPVNTRACLDFHEQLCCRWGIFNWSQSSNLVSNWVILPWDLFELNVIKFVNKLSC